MFLLSSESLSWNGVCKKIHRKFGHWGFFSKSNFSPFSSQTFCGWFRMSLSFLYFVWLLKQFSVIRCRTLLWMHVLLINSNISEGPVYASSNLGQSLNVALLDLVAVVVSLLPSCNIQTPSNVQRRQIRLRKNVNYCLLNFISLTLWKPLEPKKKTTELR